MNRVKLNAQAGPIFLQIAREVERSVVRRELKPGDKLPSARDLAQELKVNPNTVIHAYEELGRRGITETRRGLGTFMRDDAPVESLRKDLLAETARLFLAEASALGLSLEEAVTALKEVGNDRPNG